MKREDVKVGQEIKLTKKAVKQLGWPFGEVLTVSEIREKGLELYPVKALTKKGDSVLLYLEEVEPALESAPAIRTVLPTEATDRKQIPIGTGVIDYFPAALAEVAKVSHQGNQQHNPGQPLHWARKKSTDQADTIIRHFLERGKLDSDGMRHSAKLAWRALALLQLELEAEGAPLARGASNE